MQKARAKDSFMLDRFRKAKQAEIALLRALQRSGTMPAPYQGRRPCFTATLRGRAPRAVIAEYKRASPSRGDINMKLEPEQAADLYAAAGAGALSVLTEERYFKGDTAFLTRMTGPGLPLLRKDFIFDPLQVVFTASTPASALLLIVRMLDDAMLSRLIALCRDFGLAPVVEVFDTADLARARACGADIIQVNNRDLDSLRIDTRTSCGLLPQKAGHEFWITASGIAGPALLHRLLTLGFDAALIGSSLMQGADPGARLRELLRKR